MKSLLIKVCVLLVIVGVTGCKEKAQQIGAGHMFSCAVHQGSVSCWGRYIYDSSGLGGPEVARVVSKQKFVDPTLAVGGNHYCVLDEATVQCFLSNEEGQTDVPQLNNPRELAAGSDFSCVLDESGLVCWGNAPWLTDLPDNLVNPRNLVAGSSHICLRDDNGTHCTGYTPIGSADPSPPEDFSSHTLLTGSPMALHICGLQDVWKCWADYSIYETPENLQNIDIVVPGYAQACAIADGQVVCWGDGSYDPINVDPPDNITNPSQLAVGVYHACVIADEGVKCWGDLSDPFPAIEVPPYL